MPSMGKIITDLRRRLTGATNELQSEIARLRSEIADRRKALHHAQRAPLPLSEIAATRIPHVVEEHGRRWLDEHGSALVRNDRDRALGSPGLRGSVSLPWGEGLPWGALCAARPDLAAEILTALVGQVPYNPGPASGERPGLTETLARELAELEVAEETIIDSAAGAGVEVVHRAEVRQRREREARQREREEAAAVARQQREAAVNERHERAVPSAYLHRERS